MSELLLIRFDRADGDDAATFMVCNDFGQVVQPPRRGTLDAAAAAASLRRVVGLLPASEVVTLDADLPSKAGAKLLQAVPYALEEQVADDIDDLHFAIGARAADGRTPVCIVARTLMQSIDDACAAAGLSLQALHAETALIPGLPGQLVMLLAGDELHLCAPGARAVTLPSASIAESVALVLGEAGATETLGLLVYASPADWEARGAEIEALRAHYAGLKVQLLPQGSLPWLAQGLAAGEPINLLQGGFAPRRSSSTGGWRRWRLAAALAGVFLLLSGAGNLWRASRLAAEEKRVDAAIAEAVRPLFPGEGEVRNPRRRVETQLAAVRGAGSSGGEFLPALAALAAARSAVPEAELKSLGYRSGSFEVRLKARDAAAIERVGAALRASGWATDLLGGTSTDQAYEGRIRISAAGAAPGSGS
jgi:general secretion pathway protein L